LKKFENLFFKQAIDELETSAKESKLDNLHKIKPNLGKVDPEIRSKLKKFGTAEATSILGNAKSIKNEISELLQNNGIKDQFTPIPNPVIDDKFVNDICNRPIDLNEMESLFVKEKKIIPKEAFDQIRALLGPSADSKHYIKKEKLVRLLQKKLLF